MRTGPLSVAVRLGICGICVLRWRCTCRLLPSTGQPREVGILALDVCPGAQYGGGNNGKIDKNVEAILQGIRVSSEATDSCKDARKRDVRTDERARDARRVEEEETGLTERRLRLDEHLLTLRVLGLRLLTLVLGLRLLGAHRHAAWWCAQ